MIVIELVNDGSHDADLSTNEGVGSYDVRMYLPRDGWINARVEDYPRNDGWRRLMHLAVEALAEARGETGGVA